jgi:hypothetical protein
MQNTLFQKENQAKILSPASRDEGYSPRLDQLAALS